jgi:hypothetical protein
MVIGTSRCAHVLRYLFCCRVHRALQLLKCSNTAVVSGEPVMRNARANARRRIAASRHCGSGCNQAPRPGSFLARSTVTACSPFPSTATTRSSSTASSRFRQPTHVRTGPPVGVMALLCIRAEVSRWITAESTVCLLANRNGSAGRRGGARRQPSITGRAPLRVPRRGWAAARRRCECRSASRSAGRPGGHSGPPCRSQGTAGNRGLPPGRRARTRR